MITRLSKARLFLLMLTALATLLAGMPRLRCGCSAAPMVASAVAIPVHFRTCCCDHGAIAERSGEPCPHQVAQAAADSSTPTCCRGHHDEPAPASRDTASLKSAICQKVLTSADTSIVQTGNADKANDLTQHLVIADLTPAFAGLSLVPAYLLEEFGHEPCPPPDLVTVLQRLTI